MAGLADSFRDFAQSASNAIAGNVSAPVDGIAWALRKAGVPVPAAPMGGSDWMTEKGLTRTVPQGLAQTLGEAAGMAGPMVAAAKVPQIASGLLKMGENAMAPATLSKQAGVFIGPGAKTWNASEAARAKAMADAGTDARQVWGETGTWKGPDGAWRQEIPDNMATVGSRVQQGKTIADISSRAMFDGKGGYAKLGDVLNHDDLYKAYPASQDMAIAFDGPLGGAYSKDTMGRGGMGSLEFGYESKGVSTPMHEMQHAVQQREGWAKGGSPENFTQGKDAELARDALSFRREIDTLGLDKGADWSAKEHAVENQYRSIDALDWLPSVQARDLARDVYNNPNAQLQELVSLYGLDKQTSPIKPNELYKRLAGEAEARATQARIPLDAAQRRAMFPDDSYDVPIKDLILRGITPR